MSDPIIIEEYSNDWPNKFKQMAQKIRNEFNDLALRIDHIGSTSIPNLKAKPVIDIQISVKDFTDLTTIINKMDKIGFYFQENNDDKTHLFFREKDGKRNYHIHIRIANSFSEVFNLLFRDYLRTHDEERLLYQQTKEHMSKLYKNDREQYTESKSDVIWEIIRRANKWNQDIGWTPKESDL